MSEDCLPPFGSQEEWWLFIKRHYPLVMISKTRAGSLMLGGPSESLCCCFFFHSHFEIGISLSFIVKHKSHETFKKFFVHTLCWDFYIAQTFRVLAVLEKREEMTTLGQHFHSLAIGHSWVSADRSACLLHSPAFHASQLFGEPQTISALLINVTCLNTSKIWVCINFLLWVRFCTCNQESLKQTLHNSVVITLARY